MQTWIKWIGAAFVIPMALIILLSVLLYIPAIQQSAVDHATTIASKALNRNIEIDKLRLSFPLDLQVIGARVMVSPADTMISLGKLTVGVSLLPLFNNRIEISKIELEKIDVDTRNLLPSLSIHGSIERILLSPGLINLSEQTIQLNLAELSEADLYVTINPQDSVIDPSPSDPLKWKIILDQITLNKVELGLSMKSDSLRLHANITQAKLNNGLVDLETMRYEAAHFRSIIPSISYDNGFEPPVKGIDPSHLLATDLLFDADSILYQERNLHLRVIEGSLTERSGLKVSALQGTLRSDEKQFTLSAFALKTPHSQIDLNADIPWSALDSIPQGKLTAELFARLGKEDLIAMSATFCPDGFFRTYPEQPITLNASVEGNLTSLHLRDFTGVLPGAFRIRASAYTTEIIHPLRRSAQLKWNVQIENLNFLLSILPAEQRKRFKIPQGMIFNGTASLLDDCYQTQLSLVDRQGKLAASAIYHPALSSYHATLQIDSLQPIRFMPHDSLTCLTAYLTAEGRGYDLFSPATRVKLNGEVKKIRYGATNLSNVSINGWLKQQQLRLDLNSNTSSALLHLLLTASLKREQIETHCTANIKNLDFHSLHWTNDSLSTSLILEANATSNLKESHRLYLTVKEWKLKTPNETFSPRPLILKANTNPKEIHLSAEAGDLRIRLEGHEDILTISNRLHRIADTLSAQWEREKTFSTEHLRPLFPSIQLSISGGKENPLANYLKTLTTQFDSCNINAAIVPTSGITMEGTIYGMTRDTLRIDTLRMSVRQGVSTILYRADIVKNRYRNQEPFSARMEGQLKHQAADILLTYLDGTGKTGILLGAKATLLPELIRLHIIPDQPVLAFRPFHLNPDNFIEIKSSKEITANLRLSGDDGSLLSIHADSTLTGKQGLFAEWSQIDLSMLSEGFKAHLPPLKGILKANVNYLPIDSSFTVDADLHIDNLYYQNDRMGKIDVSASYLPLSGGAHQGKFSLQRDNKEVVKAEGLYIQSETNRVESNIVVTHLPIEMANPLIPDRMVRLNGALNGAISMQGAPESPTLNGFLQLDTASVYVKDVGSSVFLDNKRIEIKNGLLKFDQYGIRTKGENPFIIDGTVDFSRFKRPQALLSLSASDMELFNVQRGRENTVYGKLSVNLNSTVSGPLDALVMRGDLQLLGNTDVTYVMRDAPLTVKDPMSNLITFVSFADTTRNAKENIPLHTGGIDMLMTVRIDPSVRLNVDLSPDKSSHINLEGGGDLSFHYTPQGNMLLNGRYTLSGGKVKYALPIIPLKEFSIQNGSYVQWTGNAFDPTFNLTATERLRVSVSPKGQSSRPVNFDVGIRLSQRLENLGMQFVISAPEDMDIEEQLTRMGAEEQQKQAIAMIVTGTYMGTGNEGGKMNLSMENALNSYLQNEINNMAGSALKKIDITLGVDSYNEGGTQNNSRRTDYSFSFAKRFYNDRLTVIVGGRISSGSDINRSQDQTFIDKISLEYRLDPSGSSYAKMFYDKKYQSLLEGEVTETGIGLVLRKKVKHLRELFIFKRRTEKTKRKEEEEDGQKK